MRDGRDDARKDDTVEGPRSTDVGHADRAVLDPSEVHEVDADERPGDTSDIRDGRRIAWRK